MDEILSEIDDLMDLGKSISKFCGLCSSHHSLTNSRIFSAQIGEFKAEDGALSGTCHKQPDQSKADTAVAAYRLLILRISFLFFVSKHSIGNFTRDYCFVKYSQVSNK